MDLGTRNLKSCVVGLSGEGFVTVVRLFSYAGCVSVTCEAGPKTGHSIQVMAGATFRPQLFDKQESEGGASCQSLL